ncbi:MAG: glycosyltransferase family 2 protein [Leptolyngbyaceae cyanobacterium]
MQFSLVLATKNRAVEVERFLCSLTYQAYTDFELVIVDQNPDDRLIELVRFYSQKFPVVHLRQSKSGATRARNLGRLHAKGDVITFPDDDSVYPAEILAQVANFFQENPQWDGVVGRVYELENDQNAFLYCGDDNAGVIDLERALRIGITHATFLKRDVVKKICFDETIGPGAGTPWGCGDDVDYLFRCLQANYSVYYHPEFIVRHPNPFNSYTFRQLLQREYHYGRGNGYLMGRYFPPSFVRTEILQNCPYILTTFFRGEFAYSAYIIACVIGMSLGYWDSIKQQKPPQSLESSPGGAI